MRQWLKRVPANLSTPLLLVVLFLLAVILPSIALSLLALRAADQETLRIERNLESALLSEVNLAANRIIDLLRAVESELDGEASEIPSKPSLLERWRGVNRLARFPFLLAEDELYLPRSASPARESLRASFGAFLEGRSELPVFESIAGVYRKELSDLRDEPAPYSPPSIRREPERVFGVTGAPAGSLPALEEEPAFDFEDEESPLLFDSSHESPPPAPAFSPPEPSKKALPQTGAERQMAESRIAADSFLREQVFRKAEEEGFELLQRNVAPLTRTPSAMKTEEEPSRVVARGKAFDELRAASRGGLLPRLSDEGLDLLFWSERADGTVAGFLVDSEALKDRIIGALPEVLTDTRILSVLDDGGRPLFIPETASPPDWRRPFVAREISPVLPRWEIGAWLVDPSATASRARSAGRAVWLLVGVLFFVILSGGALILWLLSSEMRIARRKTTFVANVSHELKTPLTSIRLFAEMLLSGRQKDEERRREYLRTMVSEAERLSRLVENVLAFSRGGNGAENVFLEPLDLALLSKETLAQLEPQLARQGFSCSFASEEPLLVLGNAESLRQVLVNLISNAEKYSEDIREIELRCRREKEVALVEVADRGPGVPSSRAEKIFHEFYRGDDSLTASRSGAGLGLAIARSIARRHSGEISYAPREGGGSVFSLSIPLQRAPRIEEGGAE